MSPIITAVVISVCIIISIISVRYMGDNNPVEKVAEEIIEEETGVKIDLSSEKTTTPPTK